MLVLPSLELHFMETGSLSKRRCHFSKIIEQIHYFSDPQPLNWSIISHILRTKALGEKFKFSVL